MPPKRTKGPNKLLTADERAELDSMPSEALHKIIANCEEVIASATRDRNNNSSYKAAKEVLADFNGALRDTKKVPTAKITYSLRRLREIRGEDTSGE